MLFSRTASFFAFFFTFGALALASPFEKRQSSEITDVFNKLQSSTNAILPHLQALASNGSASDATVTPLIEELVSSFNTANTELTLGSFGLVKRSDEAIAVASVIAGIVEDVSTVLDLLLVDVAVAVPALSVLLISVDVALHELLTSVGIVLAGVLTLVAGLLVGVSGLLGALSFGLVLGLLGL